MILTEELNVWTSLCDEADKQELTQDEIWVKNCVDFLILTSSLRIEASLMLTDFCRSE